MSRRLAAVLAFLAGSVPSELWACPVCFPEKDEAARAAFFNTTVFLTLLPLGMFAGLVYLAVRRMRALDEAPTGQPSEPSSLQALPSDAPR